MATRPLTEEELRLGVVAFNPATPGMAAAATDALRDSRQPAEMQRDYGPTTEPIPNRRGERSPPPVAQPAPSSGPPTRPVVRGPAPAAVAAENGVMAAPAGGAPRGTPETPAAAPEKAPAKDMHAFAYLNQVEAMERRAMSLGRPEIAASVRQRFNQLIDGQYRSMETQYETETLPQVQAIQKQLLDYKGQQLPRELATKANEVTTRAASQQRQMFGYLYGLMRNEATKPMAVQYFNESNMMEKGIQVADFVMDGNMIRGVDASGQTVKLSSGQDFYFPIEAMEQLYGDLFQSERRDNVIVPKGAKLVNTNDGRVVADNPDLNTDEDDGPTRSEDLAAVRFAYDGVANALGLKLSDTGKLMEDIAPSAREAHTRLTYEAGKLIREQGIPPEQAVEQVMKGHRGSATAPDAAAPYTGVRPWRR